MVIVSVLLIGCQDTSTIDNEDIRDAVLARSKMLNNLSLIEINVEQKILKAHLLQPTETYLDLVALSQNTCYLFQDFYATVDDGIDSVRLFITVPNRPNTQAVAYLEDSA
ncbi:MAG: hypothetical protein AAGI23_02300 [Bacteroidota bacterium]